MEARRESVFFRIPGEAKYITMIRLAIGSLADMVGFDIEEIEDVKSAMGEACKVIACHGKEGLSAEYTVECIVDEDLLEISVTDTSGNETFRDMSMKCKDCPNEGDLGIFLIQSLMNEVEIITGVSGNKTIKMVKRK